MKDSISLFRRIRYRVWRFGGFWFLILGSILTLYVLVEILTGGQDLKPPDRLPALLLSLSGVLIGFLIIRFRPFKPK
jgi:hypothetical protein